MNKMDRTLKGITLKKLSKNLMTILLIIGTMNGQLTNGMTTIVLAPKKHLKV